MANQGWECPKCGTVHAPFIPKCENCSMKSIGEPEKKFTRETLDELERLRKYAEEHNEKWKKEAEEDRPKLPPQDGFYYMGVEEQLFKIPYGPLKMTHVRVFDSTGYLLKEGIDYEMEGSTIHFLPQEFTEE